MKVKGHGAHQRAAGGEMESQGRWTYPALELTPDVSRGEQRFAAEAALAEMRAEMVPTWVRERAVITLSILAHG